MRDFFQSVFGLFACIAIIFLVVLSFYETDPEGLNFKRASFDILPEWEGASLLESATAFSRSCNRLQKMPARRSLPGAEIGGVAGEWHSACEALTTIDQMDNAALKAYFEQYFTPLTVTADDGPIGLFTGYFEAPLKGSFEKSARYHVPLYMKPPELVSVDLGQFRSDLAGRRIAGTVENGRLKPFDSREAIESGALKERGLELLWVDDPVDAFFLHIQGSGRVELEDGSWIRVGYAAQNGHVYQAVGRFLIEDSLIAREDMSMQAIRSWMDTNAEAADALMQRNPSYIFFRLLEGKDGPFGSAGVALTPGHSLAVDRKHLPLHVPLWLSATHPDPLGAENPPLPFNRLMVAQDTGGAIAGEIRGDVFWGFGDEAAEIAGRMANRGRYWIMLPNALVERLDKEGVI